MWSRLFFNSCKIAVNVCKSASSEEKLWVDGPRKKNSVGGAWGEEMSGWLAASSSRLQFMPAKLSIIHRGVSKKGICGVGGEIFFHGRRKLWKLRTHDQIKKGAVLLKCGSWVAIDGSFGSFHQNCHRICLVIIIKKGDSELISQTLWGKLRLDSRKISDFCVVQIFINHWQR